MQIKKATFCNNIFFSIIRQVIVISLCSFWFFSSDLSAQPSGIHVLQLKPQITALQHTSSYFIIDVEDGREKITGQNLGTIIQNGQLTRVGFNQPVEKVLYDFWSVSTPLRDSLRIPATVRIEDLKFTERTGQDNLINGTLDVTFSFYWIRQNIPVQLVTYKAQQSYTRSASIQSDYENLLKNSLLHAIRYFDKWIAENEQKNPALARGISIKVLDYIDEQNIDTVFYNPLKPLVWTDFRAQPPTKSRYAASIFTSFAYEGSSVFNGLFLEVTLTFRAYMVKDMSWRKAGVTNDYSLAHEQLHFDIVQVIVNRFKKYLANTELSIEDYDSQIQYQFIEFYREMNKLQKAYDDETNHGLNAGAQRQWQEKIARELANPQ